MAAGKKALSPTVPSSPFCESPGRLNSGGGGSKTWSLFPGTTFLFGGKCCTDLCFLGLGHCDGVCVSARVCVRERFEEGGRELSVLVR